MALLRAAPLVVSALFVVAAGCGGGDGSGSQSSANTGFAGAAGSGSGSSGGDSPNNVPVGTMIEPEYGLTVFGGPGDCGPFACGGASSCDSQPWYSASSQRYGCGVHLQVTAGGKCVVVETQDVGPASWVESDAGIAILDAGPQVAEYLFGTSSIGWSDIKDNPGKYVVQVSTTSAPLGPCGALSDAGTPEGGSGGGGASGGGGSDGKGGTSGKGGGGGERDAGGYAFVEMLEIEHHHEVDIATGVPEVIPFAWHDAFGVAPPADLWVDADGRTVLQIASVGSHPFVRVGLDLVPIEADAPYRIVLSQEDGAVTVAVLDASDAEIIRTAPQAVAGGSRESTKAEIVVPMGSWRTAIESEPLTDSRPTAL